jgi:hypothetical protein
MNALRLTLLGSIALLGLLSPAQAATIFTLNTDGCTGGCGSAPFGTVTLVQTTQTLVTVTLDLSGSERFAGSGAGDALEFNVAGPITLGNISAGFGIGPAPDSASLFGSFLASITCTACQGGQASNAPGPLSFTVTSAAGVSISDFHGNAGGWYFAADIVGSTGNTGNVASNGPPTQAPEPGSLSTLLSGAGLLALSTTIRRFRRGGKLQN